MAGKQAVGRRKRTQRHRHTRTRTRMMLVRDRRSHMDSRTQLPLSSPVHRLVIAAASVIHSVLLLLSSLLPIMQSMTVPRRLSACFLMSSA